MIRGPAHAAVCTALPLRVMKLLVQKMSLTSYAFVFWWQQHEAFVEFTTSRVWFTFLIVSNFVSTFHRASSFTLLFFLYLRDLLVH